MNEKKTITSALVTILQILRVIFGFLAVLFGESDDSPGLQGIGFALILAIFFLIFRIIKKD